MDKMHQPINKADGVTLVELMIAVAIISIIAAIAVPAYNGYVRESRFGAMRLTMDGLRLILEDYRLDNGNYAPGTYTGQADIDTRYGWDPGGDLSDYTFTVSVPNTSTVTYDIWAVHTGSSLWTRCDDRMSNCCDGDNGTPAACP